MAFGRKVAPLDVVSTVAKVIEESYDWRGETRPKPSLFVQAAIPLKPEKKTRVEIPLTWGPNGENKLGTFIISTDPKFLRDTHWTKAINYISPYDLGYTSPIAASYRGLELICPEKGVEHEIGITYLKPMPGERGMDRIATFWRNIEGRYSVCIEPSRGQIIDDQKELLASGLHSAEKYLKQILDA